MTPYYADEWVTLHLGDCRELLGSVVADVLVMDPPYGIDYHSGWPRTDLASSIIGDKDTGLRDHIIEWWGGKPALVFGTWRIPRPVATRALLVWDTKGALGMGDLRIPWKPSHQEIYVLGEGFRGRRDSDVITCAPAQSLGYNGRRHPHEKPVALMDRLLDKCPPGTVFDPCAGSGPVVVAASAAGRKVIAVEIEERYCEIIARRLDQGSLFAGEAL